MARQRHNAGHLWKKVAAYHPDLKRSCQQAVIVLQRLESLGAKSTPDCAHSVMWN